MLNLFLRTQILYLIRGMCASAIIVLMPATVLVADDSKESIPVMVSSQLEQSCYECHNNDLSEGELNLEQLSWELDSAQNRERWILVHDRIKKGEMPPAAEDLSEQSRSLLVQSLATSLHEADYAEVVAQGRGPMRRLNQSEYEANLRDLLKLPHLDIRDMLPGDREADLFNKSAQALDMSRVQLDAYLNATEMALRQAVASGVEPRKPVTQHLPATRMFAMGGTYGGREAMFYTKNSQMIMVNLAKARKSNQHDPEIEMAIFRSPSWPYSGYPDTFVATEPGEYKVRFSARAVRQVRDFRLIPALQSVPMTFRARKRSGPDVSGDVRATGGLLDIQPEVGIYETTIRLKKNETFEYSLLGLPVPRAINPPNADLYYDFPPMPPGGHPGIAYQWLEITGPIDSEVWPPTSHQVLFDDLPIQAADNGKVEVISEHPEQDAIRLVRRFIRHAGRQRLSEKTLKVFEQLVLDEMKQGTSFTEALLSGYSAFLCSGHFLYLQKPNSAEVESRDSQFAIASRLSHFLWNSRIDEELLSLAKSGELRKQKVLTEQTDRLINTGQLDQFVTNFTDYWLSLKDIRRDEPDHRLYPEYRFDDYLIESMERETREYFKMMIQENLPVTLMVDADFVLVNDRLAKHYELNPIEGSVMRKVQLPASSPYGGLLTQAAILKVTANGSSTSPVIRGAWVMERIMGDPPPPPPKSVPAVEPDIRGATTIREQLAKHTSDASCAACHARFDPVGFALESFDIMGGRRFRYRSLSKGEKVTGIDRAGHNFTYWVAGPVDSKGKLLDGREFKNIKELKALLISNPRQLARNILQQFTTYATGTPVRFSDRQVIDEILDQCHEQGYRTRDLLHAFVQSRLFLGITSPVKSAQVSK